MLHPPGRAGTCGNVERGSWELDGRARAPARGVRSFGASVSGAWE
jgi:hypothetical protein